MKFLNRTVSRSFADPINRNFKAGAAKDLSGNRSLDDEMKEHKEDLNRLGNDFRMDISQQNDIPMKESEKAEKDSKDAKDSTDSINEKYSNKKADKKEADANKDDVKPQDMYVG